MSARFAVWVSGSAGYRKSTSPASSGLVYRLRNCESFAGSDAFHRSFCPSGMTTSLMSGFPSLETCTQPTERVGCPRSSDRGRGSPVVPRWRRCRSSRPGWAPAADQSSAPGSRSSTRCSCGHRLLRPSRLSGMRCAGLNGRSPPRSKIDPRSTKNGSSRGPAKTLPPPPRLATALERVVPRVRARPDVRGRDRRFDASSVETRLPRLA